MLGCPGGVCNALPTAALFHPRPCHVAARPPTRVTQELPQAARYQHKRCPAGLLQAKLLMRQKLAASIVNAHAIRN
jgi:hypothetical protein